MLGESKIMKCQECETKLIWMCHLGADQTYHGRSEALLNCPHCGSSWRAVYNEKGDKIEKVERFYFG